MTASSHKIGFMAFFRDHYLPEHRDRANVALHIFGTAAGLATVVGAVASPWPWLALLFPVVHAGPGLIGHRLFERNAAVGDVRILRGDFSPLWFIAANHLLVGEVIGGAWRRMVGRVA